MSILNLTTKDNDTKSAGGIILNAGVKKINNNLSISYFRSSYNRINIFSINNVVKTKDVTSAIDIPFSTFAYNNNRPLSKACTILINDSSLKHSLYTTGTIDPNRITNIHYSRYRKSILLARAIREKGYDIYKNIFDTGYPAISYDNFGLDTASYFLSRQMPGRLCYSNGTKKIIKIYPAKTT
jgi:hypothetical protein